MKQKALTLLLRQCVFATILVGSENIYLGLKVHDLSFPWTNVPLLWSRNSIAQILGGGNAQQHVY